MTRLRALVLDVSPASLPHLGAVARGHLRFDWLDQKTGQRSLRAWVDVERGALAPAAAPALRAGWREALGADAAVVRSHRCGAAVLVEVRQAGSQDRRLAWCTGKAVAIAPGVVPKQARVALLSEQIAALWNPDARALRLVHRERPGEVGEIALPARFGATTADTHHAPFVVIPGEGCLLVRGLSAMLVLRVDELVDACGAGEITWEVETLRPPGAEPVKATVKKRPARKPARRATTGAKAEPQESEEPEPTEHGDLRWLREVRGAGLEAAVAAVREAGLLSSFARHGAIGASLADVLRHHYEAHAGEGDRDRFLICETPFLDATDDLIADLNRLVPGRPVWRQVEVDHESVVVMTRGGARRTLPYDMTSELVEAYSGALELAGSTWRLVGVSLDAGLDGFFALEQASVARLAQAGLLSGEDDGDDCE